MTRFFCRAVLTLVVLVMIDLAPVSAQFYPRMPYPVRVGPPQIYPFSGYPIPFRPPFYLPVQTTTFVNGNPFTMTFNFGAPGITSPVPANAQFFFSGIYNLGSNNASIQLNPNFTPNPSTFWIQPQTPNNLGQIGTTTPNGLSNFGGGVVGMGAPEGANRPVVDVERNALIAAQNANRWQMGPNPDTVRWANQHNATKPVDPLVRVEDHLIYPNEDQLFSGDVLNELAQRIAALEAKGRKAQAGLIPPELLDRIRWTGGPAADAMNLLRRPAKLSYPDPLRRGALYNAELDQVSFAHNKIVTAIQSNRSVSDADWKLYAPNFKTLRDIVELVRPGCTVAEASELTHFLISYENALKYSQTRESAGVTQSKWNTVGVNISELIQHIRKHKVQFGRVGDGDEAAYSSLHRGMLDYYASLIKAK